MIFSHFRGVPLYLIILIVALPQLSETIYTPSLPAIATAFGVNASLVEHTLTIYLFGFACGMFLWGTLSDAIGRRHGLLIGLALFIGATFGCYASTSISMLMIMRFLQAFGACTGSVLGQAIARDSIEAAHRGRLFSTISMALAFGPAIGPVIGGTVANIYGWRAVFLALITLGLIIVGLVYYILPETRQPMKQHEPFLSRTWRMARAMSSDTRLLMCGILIGGVNGTVFGYFAEIPFFSLHILHIPATFFGYVSFFIALPLACGGLLSRFLHGQGFQSDVIIHYGIRLMLAAATLFYIGVLTLPNTTIESLRILTFICISGVMVGGTLIIPNVLGSALEPYKTAVGTAASLFGLYYYTLTAGFTGLMGVLHNGCADRLPLLFIIIGCILFGAAHAGKFATKNTLSVP